MSPMRLDGRIGIDWVPRCFYESHDGEALAHLLPGDKGWEDVHLLLLTAKHLDGQPYIGN